MVNERNCYLLKAINFDDGVDDNPFRVWYDCMYSIVIIADSEQTARKRASIDHASEGSGAWLNPAYTSCEIVTANTHTGVICSDVRSS